MNQEAARLAQVWQDAQLALLALQLDPLGMGIWLRAGHGPVRDAWLAGLVQSGLRTVKIPAQVDGERLLGGIDLAQTLHSGSLVQQSGLLAQADGGAVLLPMAERLDPHTLAQIAQAHDRGLVYSLDGRQTQLARFGMVALDESEADEAGLAARLSERLSIWLDLRGNSLAHTEDALEPLSAQELREARALLPHLIPTEAQAQAVCETALALGVDSLRAPLMALRLAAVHAALQGKGALDDEDLGAGARLVLGPRATRVPQGAPDSAEAAPEPSDTPEPQEPASAEACTPPDGQGAQDPQDAQIESEPDAEENAAPPPAEAAAPDPERLLAAAIASLPPHLLDRLLVGPSASKNAKGLGRSGMATRSKLRGRPLAPRAGQPGSGARLHLLATLRTAAPKQRLRGKPPGAGRVRLRAEDFQVQRFAQRSPSCLVFALDASGSAALQRLAEAKGAVELLLHEAYARRDSVCVIAFRAASAQLLLSPTRSLVRAKRALAELPGGGGTPLASALALALLQARTLQRSGTAPMLVMLSDGRANVSAAGLGGRAQALSDALACAAQWQSSGFAALWIDTASQPEPQAQALAQRMGAHYFPMPHVQAQRMAAVVQDVSSRLRAA